MKLIRVVFKFSAQLCRLRQAGVLLLSDDVGFMSGSAHGTTAKEFENAALILRLGYRHTNPSQKRSFSKTLFKPEEFVNDSFAFLCGRKTRWCHDNHVISLKEFFSNANPKCPVIVAFLNSSGVVWTENIWCVFSAKLPFSNSSGVVWTEHIRRYSNLLLGGEWHCERMTTCPRTQHVLNSN